MAWKILTLYTNILRKRPYVLQSFQTATLMALGDGISQSAIEKKSYTQIDYNRLLKFGCIGIMLGPTMVKWYRTIDKVSKVSPRFATVKKIALDQLLFAPTAIALVTTLVGLIDGKSREEIKIKLKNDYGQVLLTNYKVWPFVQFFNFTYVPLEFRVLVTGTVALGWNTYLSWKLNNSRTLLNEEY